MVAEGRRAGADVDGHVEDRPADHAHKLVLGEGRALEMQAAHRAALPGKRVVVLHELGVEARLGQALAVVGLGEEAAVVAELLRLDEEKPLDLAEVAQRHQPISR